MWFALVGFYGISTIVGWALWHINHCELFDATLSFPYVSNIYDLLWLCFMAYQPLKIIWCQILLIHMHQIYVIWFGWVLWHINPCRLSFMAYQPLWVIWCHILFIHMYQIYMICFGWVLWHINHWRLFDAKFSLYGCIKYMWFGLIELYGISTIVGYLMPHSLFHMYQIYMICFGCVLWHINHWKIFDAKFSLCICIKYIWFGLVELHGISTLVGWALWHINHCRLFDATSSLYICIKYIWFRLVL